MWRTKHEFVSTVITKFSQDESLYIETVSLKYFIKWISIFSYIVKFFSPIMNYRHIDWDFKLKLKTIVNNKHVHLHLSFGSRLSWPSSVIHVYMENIVFILRRYDVSWTTRRVRKRELEQREPTPSRQYRTVYLITESPSGQALIRRREFHASRDTIFN